MATTQWTPVWLGAAGVFLTRNEKLVVFKDPVTPWHVDKYGLVYWLQGVPPSPCSI